MSSQDIVRVLRVVEYVGPRKRVEEVVARSIFSSKDAGQGLTIRAATIGSYPDVLRTEYSCGLHDDHLSQEAADRCVELRKAAMKAPPPIPLWTPEEEAELLSRKPEVQG